MLAQPDIATVTTDVLTIGSTAFVCMMLGWAPLRLACWAGMKEGRPQPKPPPALAAAAAAATAVCGAAGSGWRHWQRLGGSCAPSTAVALVEG